MPLSNLKSAYSWYDDNSGYKPNADKLSTDFIYNNDLTSTTVPKGFDDLGNRISLIPKTSKNEFVITDQGTSSRLAQLGSGTKFPIGPKGQIHEFDIKRTGFSINKKYEDVYNNLSNFGLADTYIKDSPIDDMYNIVKVRDVASRRGYAREPFILRGIQRNDNSDPQRFGPTITLDLPRAGVITATNRMALDVARIAKFMITPKGLLFNVKQFGQQLMNPNVEGINGLPGKILNPNSTKLYTPINLMANVAGGYLGVRTRRHGLLPFGSGPLTPGKYEDVFKNRGAANPDLKTKHNRLVRVSEELGLLIEPTQVEGDPTIGGEVGLNRFTNAISRGADKLRSVLGFKGQIINTLTSISGPASVGGIGRTTITRTIDSAVEQSKFNSSLEDTRDQRNFNFFIDDATEEKSLLKDKINDKNFDGTSNPTSPPTYRDDNRVPLFDSLKGPLNNKENSRWSVIPSTDDERKNIKKKFNPVEDTDKTLREKVLDDEFDGIKSNKSNEAEYFSDYKAINASVYQPENQPSIGNNEILKLTPTAKAIAYRSLTYPNIKSITKDRQINTTTIIDYGRDPDTSKQGDQQFEFDETKTRLYQAYESIRDASSDTKVKDIWKNLKLDKTVDAIDKSIDDSFIDFRIRREGVGAVEFKAYLASWNEDVGRTVKLIDTAASGQEEVAADIAATTRIFNMNFFVAAENPDQMLKMYEKINKLKAIVGRPVTGRNAQNAVEHSYITLGKIFSRETSVIIEQCSINWDVETPWDITPDVQMPTILDITLDMKLDQANISEQFEFSFGR